MSIVKRIRLPSSRPRLLLGLVDAAIGGEEAAALRYVLVRGREVIEQGHCQAEDVRRVPASQVAIAFMSRTSFFAQAELKVTAKKPKLLELQARRFVDAEMVFNEPFRLRLLVASRGENSTTTEIAAAPDSVLADIEKVCPREALPITSLAATEIAIAALVREATQGAALVFWARGKVGLGLLIDNGVVRSRQLDVMRSVEGEIDTGDWIDFVNRADDALRNAARHLIPNQEVYLRLYFGDFHDIFSFDVRAETRAPGHVEQDRASEALEQKLTGLLRCTGECTGLDILRAPELYGLMFANPAWNWLPDDYQDRVQFHRAAVPAAALAGLSALALVAYNAYRLPSTFLANAEAEKRAAALVKDIEILTTRIPAPEDATSIEKQIRLATSTENELRLDRFLPWLTRSVAPGVAIRQVTVTSMAPSTRDNSGPDAKSAEANRSADARQAQFNASNADISWEKGGRGFYEIVLGLEAQGSYEEAQHSLATTLRQLASRLHIANSSFNYGTRLDEPNGDAFGSLTARLIAKGKDFH